MQHHAAYIFQTVPGSDSRQLAEIRADDEQELEAALYIALKEIDPNAYTANRDRSIRVIYVGR